MKKKKSALILIVLIVIFPILLGFFWFHIVHKLEKHSEELCTEKVVVGENKYERPELNAYEEVLSDHLVDMPDGFGAELIYIDEDDTYELAIIDGNSDSDGVYLYTYDDGSAISLAIDGFPAYGRYGSFSYVKKENIFSFDYGGEIDNSRYYTFFAFGIKDKKSVPYCSLSENYYDEESTVYKNFGKEITKEEYEVLYKKYSSIKKLDYNHCCLISSDEEIETFLLECLKDKECTTEQLNTMPPEELFQAFCKGVIQAECLNSDGEERYMDASAFDFKTCDDVTLMASIGDPVDIDNDGDEEFVIQNPVYGNWYFDCKDGKVICFAWPEGTARRCFYRKYNNANWVVHSDIDSAERSGYCFDKYNGDLEIVDSFCFRWEEIDGIERYYINNQEVSQGEYEELKNKVFAEE